MWRFVGQASVFTVAIVFQLRRWVGGNVQDKNVKWSSIGKASAGNLILKSTVHASRPEHSDEQGGVVFSIHFAGALRCARSFFIKTLVFEVASLMMRTVCVPKLASASFALSGLGRRMTKRLEDLPTYLPDFMIHVRRILPEDMHSRLDDARCKSADQRKAAELLLGEYIASQVAK